MLFEERAQKFEYKLNDTDDQIIEYIIDNKKEVVKLSIQSLASNLFTVPNTITRLSKKIGYDGYSQLKNSLKEELFTEQENLEDSLHFNLQKTFSLIDIDKIAIVTRMLHEAKQVLFFGVGDTVPFCEMMVKNLKIVGKQSEFYMHRHEIIHEINKLDQEDVLFLLSLSGETSQVLEIAALGKERGVKIISLTHFTRNSLQKLADIHLYCYSPGKTLNGYNITDRTPLMIVLRTLSEYYWESSGTVYKYT
ncbi:MurR/RpiR family transcriptional regulator [Peribacillus cavernae]|uniref:MurR/RpiR family transcriptional regulator n=1 Tax=Peribacillus cavernae TaxID=1674310 RepID=A0A433HWJ6_9BACI|nr:MurR/RpiR family transcriptional regulator [Peribacillus cavernae]MDQ0218134.1 DNA-binding MurR/RpiR family transcriptional regulator [Peribacillus cavernae]RUQ32713.1 MurR/RpiR family transcriptional regulator [Peribacillus cavernae]